MKKYPFLVRITQWHKDDSSHQVTYKCNAIPEKMPINYCIDFHNWIPTVTWRNKHARKSQENPGNKRTRHENPPQRLPS